ncbi:MAG TPA: hypothetical protein P5055_05455 [Candidatus Paceibacterota bacterium]|nr:hypothetical protein [Verrucomicrobiota bacterium]HSA00168.1 hypothetical protein [Candidatus Paceibacterota bacterium]
MRSRILLVISLACNVALIGVLVYAYILLQRPPPVPLSIGKGKSSGNRGRSGVVVLRQPFAWNEIESEDYPVYIENLRDIGCPESTIRDIILAEVNQLYARKRATEVITPDQQWWRSEPDPKVAKAAQSKFEALELERRSLLDSLLGEGWQKADLLEANTRSLVQLNGPILGQLSAETRLAVQEVVIHAEQRIQAYFEEQQKAAKPVSAAEFARLRQQTRDELARLLTPEQLEEYLLRNSATAVQMRREFQGLDLTPDEFRQLYRMRDGYDNQMLTLADSSDSVSVKRRQELDRQREQSTQKVLGATRYQQLQLQRDPVYLQARVTAEQLGVPQDAVIPLYQVNKARETERERIRNDVTLTLEEQTEALRVLQKEHDQVLQALLGAEAYRRYLDSQSFE